MAVAAPKRRTAPAPPPSRTTPPKRRKRAVAPAPVRRAPARAPQRARPKTRRSPGARVIPLAGRTAVAVRDLPDSGLMVRMTQGRLWIGVLGVLLVGIVGLNVVTLSFAASNGGIDEQITALERENGILKVRDAQKSATGRVRSGGGELGLAMPSSESIRFIDFDRDTIATAAARMAAASP